MRTRLVSGVLAALTATALAAGCADSSTSTAAPVATSATAASQSPAPISTLHNAADVAFAQAMIPHHTQAVAMSTQAPGRAADPQVTELASEIEQAQGPEIAQMNQMLTTWGAPQPGAADMTGMMPTDEMQQLSTLSGAAFDRTFLQMMIGHHSGAIQMARTELDQRQSPQARTLAQSIIDGQQGEITRMQALLART
jgi:uncharacterized protein (DUF305 family)